MEPQDSQPSSGRLDADKLAGPGMLQGFVLFFPVLDFDHCYNLLPWDRSPTPAPWRSLVFRPEDCQDSGPLAATQPGKWCELLLSCPLGWTEHSTSDESEASAVAGSQESCCLPGLHAQLGCVVSVELADMRENKENK